MSYDRAFAEWVCGALAPIGEISVRALCGGAGLYRDGKIFAILGHDDLRFKSDAGIDAEWDAALCDVGVGVGVAGKTEALAARQDP